MWDKYVWQWIRFSEGSHQICLRALLQAEDDWDSVYRAIVCLWEQPISIDKHHQANFIVKEELKLACIPLCVWRLCILEWVHTYINTHKNVADLPAKLLPSGEKLSQFIWMLSYGVSMWCSREQSWSTRFLFFSGRRFHGYPSWLQVHDNHLVLSEVLGLYLAVGRWTTIILVLHRGFMTSSGLPIDVSRVDHLCFMFKWSIHGRPGHILICQDGPGGDISSSIQ